MVTDPHHTNQFDCRPHEWIDLAPYKVSNFPMMDVKFRWGLPQMARFPGWCVSDPKRFPVILEYLQPFYVEVEPNVWLMKHWKNILDSSKQWMSFWQSRDLKKFCWTVCLCVIMLYRWTGTFSQILYELMIQILKKSGLLLSQKVLSSSGPNFAHVMTAQLLWHGQNWDLIWCES